VAMVDILITRAKDDGLVGGLIPHLVDGGVSNYLSYNTQMIQQKIMEQDFQKVVNMKLIICIFQ
jgi:hypothetical protein